MNTPRPSADNKSFIVIGNWKTEYDPGLAEIVNRCSGLDNMCFTIVAHHAAERHGFTLYAVADGGDTLIFEGVSAHVPLVRREMGDRFSIAETNKEQADIYIEIGADLPEGQGSRLNDSADDFEPDPSYSRIPSPYLDA